MHCFSSGRDLAEAALELGFYISISGIVTFKNAEDLRAIVRDLPLDRMLVETDCPYLAPVPYRGKRNEPAFVAATAAAVAALKGIDAGGSWRAATSANFFRLFAKARCRRRHDESDDPRLRRVDRRAGDRSELGPLRPGRSAQPPPPCLGAGRSRAGARS